jgi:predicted N-acetyltransferase YhbS
MVIIRVPQTKEDFKAYYALRYHVLREPWGHPKGTEKDDFEPISQHLMAVDDQTGEVVGVIKWLEREPGIAWLSHLAVDPACQKQGIGKLLVQAVETAARSRGYKTIGAHSRLTAADYFEKQGYQIKDLPAHYFGTAQTVWLEKEL